MGYKIVYGRKRRHFLCNGMLILIILAVCMLVAGGMGRLEALEELALQLRAGVDIGEAVDAFCQDVIHGG